MVVGVVTIPDTIHEAKIHVLWQEMTQQFDMKGVKIPTFPHVSYHVAEDYNLPRLKEALERIAADTAPFSVQTSGLGIFTGDFTILYITVTRSPELSRLHTRLWDAIDSCAEVSSQYFHPDYWLPHITLTQGNLPVHPLPDLVKAYAGRNFSWNMRIENLVVLADPGDSPFIVHERFELTGGS